MLINLENLHVVSKLLSNNAYDVPKLAKELGFYFSLRKGRIDWRKIDNIDIDNLIHERDFVNLEDNINNVINCNLDGEYDLKILDPNFIKLFKLAQLSTEYLAYMQDYLLKCLQSVQLQLKESLQENEKLKLDNTKKDEDIKSLKRKMKDKENLALLIQQLNLQSHGGCFHQCSICGKTFINAKFLQAHHERRHPESPDLQEPEKQQNSAMFDTLLNEVKVLKERLSTTERLLEENKENNIQTLKQMEQEYEKKLEVCRSQYTQQLTDTQHHLQQNMEIENIRNPFESEQLQQKIDLQENQIKSLQEAMNSQAKENLEILKNKLEEQDSIWKKRVEEMVSRHQETVEDLKNNQRIEPSKVSTNDVNMLDYENKIVELRSMASVQEQQLNQQRIELKMLREELEKVSASHMSLTNLNSKHATKVSEKPLLVQSVVSSPSEQQETVTSEETSSESTESSEQRTVVTNQTAHQQLSKYPIDLKNYHKQAKGKEVSTPMAKREPDLEVYKKPIPVSSQVFNENVSVDDGTEESSSTLGTETSTDDSQVPDIERLKQAVASNPHILKKLKEDLQSLLNQRLRDLGVDPEWSGVPQATFAQKIVTLQHQQNLTAKRYSDYFKIRKYYLNQLKSKVPDVVPPKSSTHKERATVPASDSRASEIDKIMNRVKSKAQNVLHPAKDKGSQSSSILQQDTREKNINIQKPFKLHEYGGKNSRNMRDRSPVVEQGLSVKSGKPSTMHDHSSKENLAMNIRPVTAKHGSEKIMKERGHTMLTSTPFNKRNATNSESSSPLSSTIPSPIPVLRNVLGTGESRSVLKTSATPSKNHAKKRVVFKDEEEKSRQTSKQLTEVESWDSPIEEEKLQVQDDSSISSDEILSQIKRTPSSTSIKLKTKQSATIAQLATDLNDQLKSRASKPIGGVDTAFSSKPSSRQLKDDADSGKGGGKTDNSKTMQLSDWDLEDLDTFE